jgi:hypothetical protein
MTAVAQYIAALEQVRHRSDAAEPGCRPALKALTESRAAKERMGEPMNDVDFAAAPLFAKMPTRGSA